MKNSKTENTVDKFGVRGTIIFLLYNIKKYV